MIAVAANNARSPTIGRLFAPVFGAELITAYLFLAACILMVGFRLTGSGYGTTVFTIAGVVTIGLRLLQFVLIRLPDVTESRIFYLFSSFENHSWAFLLGIILQSFTHLVREYQTHN